MEKNGNITIIMDVKNQKVMDEIKEAVSVLEGFHISNKQISFQNPGIYDLLILEIEEEPKKRLQFVNTLKTSGIVRDVFFTSSNKDPEILIEALRMGVKEFFPQPINKEDVKNAMIKIKRQKEGKKEDDAMKKGKIINVFGSKGGVGTTTIAVNLAASLATLKNPSSVVLIDMKPVFGEIATILNVDPMFSWLEVTKNISRLDPTYLMSILSRHSSGVYVLPSPVELAEDYTANPQALATLIRLMQTMFDFVVIDSGQSLDDVSREVMKLSDTVLLVCVLSLSCIINIQRLQDILQKYGYPEEEKIGIIVNRFVRKSEISLQDAEKSLNKKISFIIPNAYRVSMNAINEGKPLYTLAQGTEIWKKYRELASAFPVNGKNERKMKKEKGVFSLTSLFS